MIHRRKLLAGVGSLALAPLAKLGPSGAHAADALHLDGALPKGLPDVAKLEALPGKRPLIKLSYRPPNYETPLNYFKDVITPNDAFFVRYHLAVIPEVNAATWKLNVGGDSASSPFELTLDQLKAFDPVEITAVCQCSGNRRGLFSPHVAGVEWGYGAMGNATWKGARLKDILAKAGLKDSTKEIVINGADGPVLDATPDFVKSIPLDKAMEDTVIVAYEMNGQPLPHWNGFPARLIVPGWTATYWMKHLTSVLAISQPFDGFWMKSAYRIPTGLFPIPARFASQETKVNTPITEMVVNSIITSPAEGMRVRGGSDLVVSGIAWDAGHGIDTVGVSTDGGHSYTEAKLGRDYGRYSFRPWTASVKVPRAGSLTVMALARNKIGQAQATELLLNPAGYHHNLPHRVTLKIA